MKGEFLKSEMNKMLLNILFLLSLSFSTSFPQENTKTYDVVNRDQIQKYVYPDGSSSYYSGYPYDYGVYIGRSDEAKTIRRSICEFPMTFPAGAYVTKVEFIYKNNVSPAANFRLYYMPEKGSSLKYPDLWAMTEASGVTELGFFTGSTSYSVAVSIYELREIVNNAIESGKTKIYFCIRAANENQSTLASDFNILQLKYTYEIGTKYTIRNSTGTGKIDISINNSGYNEVSSDTVIREKIGTIIKLRAKEEQFDGTNFWVWNQDPSTLQTTRSTWSKDNNYQISTFDNIEVQDMANQNEVKVTYTAKLWRKYVINRIDKTEFDGSFQTNDVARVVEGNSVNVPYSETLTKTIGTYNFAGWTDGESSLKTPNNNTTYTALYKMTQKSNTQTAFSNSSQRKFIRTPDDGYYHLVYESMGKIWYERSTDGGTTWVIGNEGKPLNTDYVYTTGMQYTGTGSYTAAKHPSIDYYQDKVVIVWQEQSGSNYLVRMCFMQNGQHVWPANYIPFQSYGLYSEDIWPEIAVKGNGKAVIAIRRNDPYMKGLQVHYLTLYPEGGMAQEETSGLIPGSDQNTGQFTLATDRSSTDKYHIAWQQNGTSASTIMYAKFNFLWLEGDLSPEDGYYEMNIVKNVNVSNATGYYQSFSPSMAGENDGTARLAFKGYRQYYAPTVSSCNPDNLSWLPYLNKYGGEVYSPQISQGSQVYYVGWTELTGGVYRTIATESSSLRNMETVLGSSGRDMQINPGGTKLQQFSLSFNSEASALPYAFTRSTDALGDIQPNKKLPVISGRGVFLTKEESQMYFILGNVTSDGIPVDFVKAQDTVRLDGNLKKVNLFMLTEPFALRENSKVSFAAVCGTKDSATSKASLKDGQFASFKVEMIDDASGRVLGSYIDEKMDKTNIFSLRESVYKISSDGTGSKLVRLRVSVDENMGSQYTISDMFLGNGILLSKNLKESEMGLGGSVEVHEYAISQNYPNPFNPNTVINYQIPKASKVTLKVYDILGKEVATLVNGYMEMGKYSAEFNASSLPSGIYIYEIRANDFVKSSKMMLLK